MKRSHGEQLYIPIMDLREMWIIKLQQLDTLSNSVRKKGQERHESLSLLCSCSYTGFSFLEGQKFPSHLAISELLVLEWLLYFCSINSTSRFPAVIFLIAVILLTRRRCTFIFCLHRLWGNANSCSGESSHAMTLHKCHWRLSCF